jgi:hypothetical protein
MATTPYDDDPQGLRRPQFFAGGPAPTNPVTSLRQPPVAGIANGVPLPAPPKGQVPIPGDPGTPEYTGSGFSAPRSAVDDFRNSDVGRNLENAAAAVPGLGLVGGALRTTQLAGSAANAAPALGAATAATQGLRAASALPVAAAVSPLAVGAAGNAATATPQPAAPAAVPQPPAATEQMGPPLSAMGLSGAAAAPAAPANGGRPFALGSAEDTTYQLNNLRANATPPGSGPTMSVIPDGSDARQAFFDNANLRTQAARTTYSPRKGYSANDAAIQAAALPIQNRAKLSELSLKNAGDQSIARMQDATTQRGQDVSARTAAQAQEVTLRGQDVNAKTAATQARQQQMQQDRTFNLDVARFGQEVASKNFDTRQKAVKDVQDQVAGMLPPGPDGKPDTANAARYASALNAQVAQRQEQLRAQVARGGPNAPGAQAELEQLDSKGLAAMDQAAVRKFIVGQQVADLAQQTGTSRFNPIGTAAANSTAPVTSLRERPSIIGSDYVTDRGDVIPGRYLRNNGQINQDYNTLIQR